MVRVSATLVENQIRLTVNAAVSIGVGTGCI